MGRREKLSLVAQSHTLLLFANTFFRHTLIKIFSIYLYTQKRFDIRDLPPEISKKKRSKMVYHQTLRKIQIIVPFRLTDHELLTFYHINDISLTVLNYSDISLLFETNKTFVDKYSDAFGCIYHTTLLLPVRCPG